MSHTYVCHRDTRVHTHVPQHVSTSTMIHTPFTSCLSGLFAHIGMLTSVNDGSIAINQCHKKHLAKSLPSYPLVSVPIERSGCSDGCVTSKASIPLDLVPHGVGTLSPVKPSFHPFLCLSLSGSGDLPFCFLSLWIWTALGISHGTSVKQSHLPVQETRVQSVGQEDPLEKGTANPLQDSCLGNPMHRGAWRATAHGVTKSETSLSKHAHTGVSHSICPFVTDLEVHQCFHFTCCSMWQDSLPLKTESYSVVRMGLTWLISSSISEYLGCFCLFFKILLLFIFWRVQSQKCKSNDKGL